MKVILGTIAAIALVSACGSREADITTTTACGDDGGSVTPLSVVLLVGDTVRVHANLRTMCTPTPHALTAYFISNNTSVASVDSASGLVTARASGITTIIAKATSEPSIAAAMVVTVASPAK